MLILVSFIYFFKQTESAMTFEYVLDGWTCMSKLFAIFLLLTTVTIVHHIIAMTENMPLTFIDRSIFAQFSLNSLIIFNFRIIRKKFQLIGQLKILLMYSTFSIAAAINIWFLYPPFCVPTQLTLSLTLMLLLVRLTLPLFGVTSDS